MKKLFLTFLSFAGPVRKTIIAETQLDDDPTSITGTYNIADYKKVAFFVKYDETEVGNSISIAVTLDISYDGTNWIDASFYDYDGGTTLQTSETISSDGWYYCYFNPYVQTIHVRVAIAATNTDADDLAVVTVYMVGIR